jgi:hypothetical protein
VVVVHVVKRFTFLGAAAARDVDVVDILEVEELVDISLLTDEILQAQYFLNQNG